ncbi:hypothetical protein OEZ85_001673 [Tetradesmus obliquus]|uniref:SBP-type domain-containing protein n=1 Tax=Tetradesmus obliquus TaxID=3088 RepID=A0ABY8U0J0_TETOB|nr:hypothetical protein OEZ85_001673 [Tetradesmus obliquus]
MANSVPLDNCPGASPRKDRWCKAVACAVDLHGLGRPYCLKKGLCPEHLKANAVRLKGGGDQLWRFCQQCGKLEPLSCFKQGMRSCRKGLAKRRQNLASKQEQQQPEHEISTHRPQPAARRDGSSSCSRGCHGASYD